MDITFGLLVGLVLLLLYLHFKFSKLPPFGKAIPGPKGWPIIGSLFEFELGNLHNVATKYAKQFGEIVQLSIFNENIVFLNTAALIRKAYTDERYKRQLNDRPVTFYGEHFQYGSKGLIMNKQGYSTRHGDLRKHFVKGLKTYGDGVKAFEDIVKDEIRDLMAEMDAQTDREIEAMPLLEQSLSNLLSVLMCGERRATNESVRLFWDYIDAVNYAGTPRFDAVMKAFPFVRHLPGPYGRACKRLEELREKLVELFLTKQKATFVPGKVRGLMDYLLHEQLKETSSGKSDPLLTDQMLFALIADIVLAGLITTRAALANMFLCVMHHPDYQRRIQAELDRVVGRDRTPALADRYDLPLLEATAMESQRYLTTGVVMAHLCNEDVEFEGYYIKKNAFLFPNMWHIHHDEETWGDPWVFRPERFLDEQGQLLPVDHPIRQSWLIFGAGRRHCVGESLARSRLYLYMATILQSWNISPSRDSPGSCDPRGDDIEVKIVTTPKPFKCRLEKR